MLRGILQRLVQLSTPAPAPDAWRFLEPSAAMRDIPVAGSGFWDSLSDGFSGEQLLSARVVIQNRDGETVLNPVLMGSDVSALFVARENERPYDLINANGSLSSDDPPAFEACNDYFTKRWSGKSKRILVAATNDDLGVLRMLALPCTIAAGLANMDGQQFRRLCQNRHPPPAATAVEGYQLVFVGIELSILSNQMPEAMRHVIEYMLLAEETYGIGTEKRIGVWQPSEDDFKKIASAAKFKDRGLAHKLIRRSVNNSIYSVREFQENASIQNPAGYDATHRELLRIIIEARENGWFTFEIAKKLDLLNRSFEKHVIEKILKDAMSATDSVDRCLLISAAELMEHWHKSSMLVRSTEAGVAERNPPGAPVLSPEAFSDRLRIADELVKIHRALTRRK